MQLPPTGPDRLQQRHHRLDLRAQRPQHQQRRVRGADRQLLRPDGVKELHALYEMQTDDGAVLTIDNRVLIDEAVQPVRYALSRISVAAPDGQHAWLNRRLFVGTLLPLRPTREAVLIRAFLMTN